MSEDQYTGDLDDLRCRIGMRFRLDASVECLACVFFHPDRRKSCSCLGAAKGYGQTCAVKIYDPYRPAELERVLRVRKPEGRYSKDSNKHKRRTADHDNHRRS